MLNAAQAGVGVGVQTWITSQVIGDRMSGFREDWAIAEAIPGWFNEANAATFWALVADVRPSTVVEIGSYLGRSTILIGLSLKRFSPHARLVTIDPHTGDMQQLQAIGAPSLPTLELFSSHVEAAGISDIVDVRVATSDAVGASWSESIDILFIDGWHSREAVTQDSMLFASHLASRGLVCYDDYLVYREVQDGVDGVSSPLGLHHYGTVMSQAWAGRQPTPPRVIERAVRSSKPYERAINIRQWYHNRVT